MATNLKEGSMASQLMQSLSQNSTEVKDKEGAVANLTEGSMARQLMTNLQAPKPEPELMPVAKSEDKGPGFEAAKRLYSNQGLYPTLYNPAMAIKAGLHIKTPPPGGFDEFGMPYDEKGQPYYKEGKNDSDARPAPWGNELTISSDKSKPSFIRRALKSIGEMIGRESESKLSEAAKAQSVVQIMAKEAGVPLNQYRQSPEFIEQAASSFVNAASLGIVPAIKKEMTGEIDFEASSTAGHVGHALGSLGGMMLGPFKIGQAAAAPIIRYIPKATQEGAIAGRILKEALHDSIIMGTGIGISGTGEALEKTTFTQMAGSLGGSALSGAAVGSIFGAARGIFPKEGMEKGARIVAGLIGLNAYRAAEVGGNPFTDRRLGDVVFDILLDAAFLYRGLPKSRANDVIKDLEDINKSYENIKKIETVAGNAPSDIQAKVEAETLNVERTRLRNKYDQFVKKIGGDIELLHDYAMMEEGLAKARIRPVDVSRPEMAEDYVQKPVRLIKKEQVKINKQRDDRKKEGETIEVKQPKIEEPLSKKEKVDTTPINSVEDLQVLVDSVPELKGKVSVDALGEEGSMLPSGMAQITVLGDHPAAGGSFSVKANLKDIVSRLEKEAEIWTKAKEKKAASDESIKKFKELDESDETLTPQQIRALDSILEDIEDESTLKFRDTREIKLKEREREIDYFGEGKDKVEPINEVDESTGNAVLRDDLDSSFMKSPEDVSRLHQLFEERIKSVMSDPELYVQKLINDVRRWVQGEEVDISKIRNSLSDMSSRSNELREFFNTGIDHMRFMDVVNGASKWARNVQRPGGGLGGSGLNMMVPLDKIPDTVKSAIKYLFPGQTKFKFMDLSRNERLWRSTGFWIGRDGKWRFEIDPADIKIEIPKYVEDSYKNVGEGVAQLKNLMYSDKLYKVVPRLENILVKYDRKLDCNGCFDSDTGIIFLKDFRPEVMIHEVQHAVNNYVGSNFLGSNLAFNIKSLVVKTLYNLSKVEKDHKIKADINKVINDLVTSGQTDRQALYKISKPISSVWGTVDKFIDQMSSQGFDMYREDPGEMESRLASYRLLMSKSRRSLEPPWVSLDRMLVGEAGRVGPGFKLYTGGEIEAAGKAIVEGARRVARYTSEARGMKKLRLDEAYERSRREFVRSVIDRSGNIKESMLENLGEEGYNIIQRLVLAKGASARASKELKQMRSEVYSGLSRREKKILDDIILDDRMIDIAKYKSEKEFTFPKGLTVKDFIAHRAMFGDLEKLTPAQVRKLDSRAAAYFEWMKKPLSDMMNAGLISQTEYDDLVAHNYRRIKLVDIFDKRYGTKLGDKRRTVYDSGIESLAKGRDTDIYEPSSEVMALEVFNRSYGRILNNEANRALLNLAETDPTNPFVRVRSDKPKSQRSADDMIPSGWHRVFVFDKGKRRSMWISPDMGREWIVNSPEISYKMGQVLRWASGSPVLRTFATGINWGFAIANVPRDIMHAWFTARRFENGKWESLYSPVAPLYSMQIGRDLATVFSDAATKKGRYNEYIDEGGGMEFLVHQGRLLQRGRHIDSKINDILDFMGYFGETGEILTRLAIRERVIRKEANKRGISVEEARKDKDITREATFVARDYMDFGQGGGISKAADNALPYLNAAIQGSRGLFRSFKPGSGMALSSTFKLGQLASVVVGTYIASNAMAPKTMNALQGDKNTEGNLVIPLGDDFGFVDDQGNDRYVYFKIPMDPGQKFFKTLFEGATDKWLGKEVDTDRIVSTLKDQSPVGISQLPPTVSATLGYLANKDFWLNEDIWKQTSKPLSWPDSSEEYTSKTPQAYIDLGKATGLSPERTKYAVEELVTNGTIWSYLLNQGYDAAFGDLTKDKKEQHIAMAMSKFPGFKRFIGVTNPYSRHSSKIEKAEEDAVLDRFVENRNMDMLVEAYLYGSGKVSREEVIKYAKSFNDVDKFDRLYERLEWEESIKSLPEKSFWRRMKGLPNEAKAEVFIDRLNKASDREKDKLWEEFSIVSAAGDVISDDLMDLIARKRSDK